MAICGIVSDPLQEAVQHRDPDNNRHFSQGAFHPPAQDVSMKTHQLER
jgi:hypothetical protein